MAPARDKREYGLTAADRSHEIARKFGAANAAKANALLASVQNPTDQLLAAVIFLARPGRVEDLIDLVASANDHPARLLSAAATADERRSW
jgi:hypothetical protein